MSPLNIVLLFCAVAIVLGLLVGKRFWAMTETEIINAAAAQYVVAEAARGQVAKVTDCAARPDADTKGWIMVTCLPSHLDASQTYRYRASRWGVELQRSPY
ncbi:hypothetical protein [Roseovarius sp. 2305UL8-3]|uniref:hypothetical protein n=1 Tax=Roseovarius conchicola TaxID=3121636 RepID=UPI003526CD59